MVYTCNTNQTIYNRNLNNAKQLKKFTTQMDKIKYFNVWDVLSLSTVMSYYNVAFGYQRKSRIS